MQLSSRLRASVLFLLLAWMSVYLPSPRAAAAQDAPPIRFAVIGDYGHNTAAEAQVAALVAGWNPDFVITTGDNNYPSGEAATIDQHISASITASSLAIIRVVTAVAARSIASGPVSGIMTGIQFGATGTVAAAPIRTILPSLATSATTT
jgi:hypothetical protein